LLLIVLATIASSACGGGDDGAPARAAPLAAPTPVDRGTLLQATWSAYPRLVRLEHQSDTRRNGRIVASLTEHAGGRWQAGFHASSDDGATFARIGALVDAEFAKGLCCGTLFEMPQAVGALPAGTLLYSASIGADTPGAFMEHRIYRSDDGGASFRRIEGATCGRSSVPRTVGALGSGIWEPEFLVAADGSLACIYSDETEPGKSQVLKLTATSDGTSWSPPRVIVAGPAPSDRPGMAGVRKLPSGRYAMTFETCSTARLDCAAHLMISTDGLAWGALGELGTRPQTAAGQYFRHAPTLAWTGAPGRATGGFVLIGQIVAGDGAGVDVSANGRAFLLNERADGGGEWRLAAAPIGLASAPQASNWCQNYSTPLLPSPDGRQILMMQTDSTAQGGCEARFGRGPLPP
jgi:hypothetical protein